MQSWSVYLNGAHIDTVFFSMDCDAEYVKHSLVSREGFDPAITVQKIVYSLPKDFK